jgi:hypothetical protein
MTLGPVSLGTSCLSITLPGPYTKWLPSLWTTKEAHQRETFLTWHQWWCVNFGANTEPWFGFCGNWTGNVFVGQMSQLLQWLCAAIEGRSITSCSVGHLWQSNSSKCNMSLDSGLLGFWTLSSVRYSKKQKNTTFRKLDLFPSSGEGAGDTLGRLERACPNHWANWVGGSFPLTWGRKQIRFPKRCVLFFRIPDDGQSPKTQ